MFYLPLTHAKQKTIIFCIKLLNEKENEDALEKEICEKVLAV